MNWKEKILLSLVPMVFGEPWHFFICLAAFYFMDFFFWAIEVLRGPLLDNPSNAPSRQISS